jgi:hypothetical protein
LPVAGVSVKSSRSTDRNDGRVAQRESTTLTS